MSQLPIAEPLTPYVALVAAILHRAIEDAQGRCTHADPRAKAQYQAEARLFLADQQAIAWWYELCGLDSLPLLRTVKEVLAH
jgi:hypothetical protein